jgi:putative ABC transport system substrate-binding protein
MVADLSGKRLELLKEIVPKLSRLAVFETSTNWGNAQQLRETKDAADAFRVKLQELDVLGPNDVESVFRAASKGRADAGLVLSSAVTASYRKQFADFAVRIGCGDIPSDRLVEDGGLMSYGVNVIDRTGVPRLTWTRSSKALIPVISLSSSQKVWFVVNLKAAETDRPDDSTQRAGKGG